MKIEKIPTEKLIPYARNAKKHDAAQVSKLAGSIREFGFNNPVLIDKDNGIIAGHGRVMAAQQLGLADVPCIRLGHLTDNQRKAYILADNRLAEVNSGWDEELLKLEIKDIDWGDIKGLSVDDFEFGEIEDEAETSDADAVKIVSCFEVVAECQHEEEQNMVYNILNERGIKCRLATL